MFVSALNSAGIHTKTPGHQHFEKKSMDQFAEAFIKILIFVTILTILYFALGIHNKLFGEVKSKSRKRSITWKAGFEFKIAKETNHFALIYNPLYYGGYNQHAVVLDMFEDLHTQGYRFIDSPNGYLMICEKLEHHERYGSFEEKKPRKAA
jgi:hypothetical protein